MRTCRTAPVRAQQPPLLELLHQHRQALQPALKDQAKAMDGVRGAGLLSKLASEETLQAKLKAAEQRVESACPGVLAALNGEIVRSPEKVRALLNAQGRDVQLMKLVGQGIAQQAAQWQQAVRRDPAA